MNIFYLDKNIEKCAKAHCDKHCVKMILEYAQLLSTAHRILDGDDGNEELYKVTHKNHPSSVWVRQNRMHYRYVYDLFSDLCAEYAFRYSREHKTGRLLAPLYECPKALENKMYDFWEPPQCMHDQYKCNDTVQAYRNYYNGDKAYMAVWKYTSTPTWFKGENVVS